jgi:hypothetical protein
MLPAFPTGGYAITFDIEKDIPYRETREYVATRKRSRKAYCRRAENRR